MVAITAMAPTFSARRRLSTFQWWARLLFLAAAVGLLSLEHAQAGRAVFTGQEDEVQITADGLTKVVAGNNHYQLSGGSTSFTDDCTGPQGDNQAIHNLVISEINQDLTDALGNADWTIELQIDPLSGGIRTDGIAGTNNPSGQAWGVGIRFANGTNETTSASGVGNFGRGADLIFGFTETSIGVVTSPVLTPYVLLVGADFSLSEGSQFFNFMNAVDFDADPGTPQFFQDFVGTNGKLTLSHRGLDEFSRPVITIGSEAGDRPSTWAWTAGNTGTPGPPVVNANFEAFGLDADGGSPGGFGSQNVNFNGLIPAEVGFGPGPIGKPVTSLFMFVENETTWVQYADGVLPEGEGTSDECYGTQPDSDQSNTYAIDFDFPVGPGEVDSRDSDGLLARIIADGGTRDDINSYGNVEIQNAIPADAGRFACLTITSDAIVKDINPNSECLGPVITAQPEALTAFDLRTATPPQNLSLSVAALASEGSLSYQWKKDGKDIRALVGSSAGGITEGVGILPNAGVGSLRVELPDDGVAITSQTWTLVMTGVNDADPTQADFSLNGSVTGSTPGPTSSDDGAAFAIADGIEFHVTQDNTDSTTDFEIGDQFQVTVTAIPVVNATADNSTFSITDVDRDDDATYTVCVTDDNRTITSNAAIVTVIDPRPTIVFSETWETEPGVVPNLYPALRPQILFDSFDCHNCFFVLDINLIFGDNDWFYLDALNATPAANIKIRNVITPDLTGERNMALQRTGSADFATDYAGAAVGNNIHVSLRDPIDINAITSLTIAFRAHYGAFTATGGETDGTEFLAPYSNLAVSVGTGASISDGSAEYTIELTNHVIDANPASFFASTANPGATRVPEFFITGDMDIFPAAVGFNIGINRWRAFPAGLRKTIDSTNDGGIVDNFGATPVDNELLSSTFTSGGPVHGENLIDSFGLNPLNSAQVDTSSLPADTPLADLTFFGQEYDVVVSFSSDPLTTENTPGAPGGFDTDVAWRVTNITYGTSLGRVDSGGVVTENDLAAAFPFNQRAAFVSLIMGGGNGFGDGPGDAGTPDVGDGTGTLDTSGGSTDANGALTGIAVVDEGVLGIPEVETITVTALGGGDWSVVSSTTLGARAAGMANATEGALYTNGSVGDVRFTITSGGLPFAAGDVFTFTIDKILNITAFGRTNNTEDMGLQGTWIDDILIITEGVVDVTPASARDWDIFE